MFTYRVRSVLTATVALLVLALTTAVPAGAARNPHHHARHRHSVQHGIPQHNGGDQDADNNGGPSDGDGSI
jgi:hypothetical protein